MKRFFLFVFVVLFIVTGCVSNNIQTDKNIEHYDNCCNLEFEDDLEKEIIVTGIVDVKTSNDESSLFFINENNESRSKISFQIREEGSSLKAYNFLKDSVGKEVSVRAVVVDSYSPWSKVITLLDIISKE